ncbi:hypothetical protein NDU88_006522 [Pleurodeles waltl]|uniref:Uncharacterized protein n=1 Tax=Pleurodeles waltl TaxID=8319 RepID=A0AAV7X1B9_PLEWA|nr:hypothetical protein NDU88_006522 [Pleurodeles waltl]
MQFSRSALAHNNHTEISGGDQSAVLNGPALAVEQEGHSAAGGEAGGSGLRGLSPPLHAVASLGLGSAHDMSSNTVGEAQREVITPPSHHCIQTGRVGAAGGKVERPSPREDKHPGSGCIERCQRGRGSWTESTVR